MNRLSERVQEKYYRNINIPAGDLRVSVIANCNMRCFYCHNEGQGEFRAKKLSVQAVRTIVSKALKFGVKKVRLTGGEPLLHPDIFEICRMLKHDLNINNVGLNTNGVLIDRMIPLAEHNLLSQIVIGLDFFDSEISKDSPIGISSAQILQNVLTLKELGQNVQIACVYNHDYSNVKRMAEWALSNGILLKLLEVSDETVDKAPTEEFMTMCEQVIADFGLTVGITTDLKEYYGVTEDGKKILFFHSHCRIRECRQCAHMHMRVTADGYAKPCILRKDTEFPLLWGDFDENMRRAIHNLGVPPERPAV